MTLKLDISNAYDKIEQGYLKIVKERLGFFSKWINLIMECITTVSYSIIMNNQGDDVIKLARGIRHGDSIFPYLFLLCVEGLSALVDVVERRGET